MPLLALLVALVSPLAHAGPEEHEAAAQEDHAVAHAAAEHHDEHPMNIVVVRAIAAMTVKHQHPMGLVGAGAYYERVLVPGLLETEVAFAVTANDAYVMIPLEVFVKVPVQLARHTEIHAGVGALADIELHDGETRVSPGAILTADLYQWFDRHLGVVFEVDALAVAEVDEVVPEIEGAVGLAYRW